MRAVCRVCVADDGSVSCTAIINPKLYLSDTMWCIPAITRFPQHVTTSALMDSELCGSRAGQQSLLMGIIGSQAKAIVYFRDQS